MTSHGLGEQEVPGLLQPELPWYCSGLIAVAALKCRRRNDVTLIPTWRARPSMS